MRSNSINRIAVSSTARAPFAEASKNAPDLASPCCPSKENSCFKENININKSGASNLSLEPHQMKKKKKGGKHNLRKSLAWDRAFFTEEGVLDPLELSAISGVSCRGGLPFISEDTPVSSGQDEDFRKDKENNLSSPKLNLSSSNCMASTSVPSHKVPTNAGSKLGSKYGDCPRPSPSPSLKKRANANVGKASGSALKLSKVPGLKPGLSPVCATIRSTILRGSRVKHNQIAQPDFSIQRDVELNSSFRSHKNSQNTSRATTFQSARHSDGDSGSSSFNRYSPINMIPMTVDKDNSGSKMIPVNVTEIRRESSCDSQRYDSATFATSSNQNAHINGRTLHPLQNQTIKPSGLRMPSPSLSFFSQPKPSAFRDIPLRDHVYGSQNHGSSRLLDSLSRTTKLHDKIPDTRISSSKAIFSRSESAASSHARVIDLVKPKLDQKPMYEVGLDVLSDVSKSHPVDKIFEDSNNVFDEQIQDLLKKNVIVRISHEEAAVEKIGTEVSSQNGSREHAMDNIFKNASDDGPVKSESSESEWRNAEQLSKQNCAIPESQTISAIDEQPENNKACNLLVLNRDPTQCTDGLDDRVQNTSAMHSGWRKTISTPDCHEAHLEKTDPLLYSVGENKRRTDKNISKERATEKLDVCQQNGIYFSFSENMKASERGEAMAGSPNLESKHLYANKVLTDNLPAAEAPMQNSVYASLLQGCKNDTDLMPEVGDDINQPGESPEAQDFHQKVAMESKQIGKLNKRLSLQDLQQEENVDKLLLVASERKDGNKVIDTKLSFSLSLGKRHKNNLGKETAITQPLRMVECDSVGNSFSSESCSSPIRSSFDCDDDSSYGNLSDYLHQKSQRIETNYSPLSESTIHQLSPGDNTLIKETEELPCIQVGVMDNGMTSTTSLKDSESDIDNVKGLLHTKTLRVQSPENNMLNNSCFQQSECMALAGDEFVAESLVHSNDCIQAKHLPDVLSEVNAVGSMKMPLTNEEVFQSISRSSNTTKESPLKDEICNEEYETGGGIEDAITDPSRVEAFSDTVKVGFSEDTDNSLSCLRPVLDHDKVETTLLSNNEHGDGLEEKKSLSVVIPPNATPFSDEWLAAIEAAGEDILTRKGGAVQNSPPDKSLPEPSPWSPVKRKNNQIGPFDCTKKFTAQSEF